MDAQGLVDVNGNKVIISGSGTRCESRVSLGGLLTEA